MFGLCVFNFELQKLFNLLKLGQLFVECFGWIFCCGDKVMQIENDYDKDVFNGDSGIVLGIDMEIQEFIVSFDGCFIVYCFVDFDQLVFVYVIIIYKLQGFEYLVVFVFVFMQQFVMFQKNFFYMVIMCGKKFVILIGEK